MGGRNTLFNENKQEKKYNHGEEDGGKREL